MRKSLSLLVMLITLLYSNNVFANEPDSAYVFIYSTAKNDHHNGLHYAWSINQKDWHSIGPEYQFLFSDFGAWGSQKKMFDPYMFMDENNTWHCLWALNNNVGQFAYASTKDMINWTSQIYPQVTNDVNTIENIEAHYDVVQKVYVITWYVNDKLYKTTTVDFKDYTSTEEAKERDRKDLRSEVTIDGEKQKGMIHQLSWENIDKLIKYEQWMEYHNQQRGETTSQDPVRFKDLKPVEADITLHPDQSKAISDKLVGIFFEDINYAADGGLYAELIQNRGFEYNISDTKGRDKTWTHDKAWSVSGEGIKFSIDTLNPVHVNTKHYALLDVNKVGAVLVNEGFDGIYIKEGEKYDFSVFAKYMGTAKENFIVSLIDDAGKVMGSCVIKNVGNKWKKYSATITVNSTVENAKLSIQPSAVGKLGLDMVSLFPQNTFKGRKNGLRADLAQTIADLHPKFVRFPGGCVSHGDGIDNIYHWKNSIGPLEARKPNRNIWNYHQSLGLGYFEYFQFCEDLGAEPLPVVAAGVPCQNSSTGGHGQQGGIPMCDMDDYVQDVLDLIEWANGDKNTQWGKLRAEAGHPKPFNLKYIGIGNEDLITDIFKERFTMIFNAVKEKYPEITVIGTVGPFYRGTDYEVGWDFAAELGVPVVDEHYYQPPGWFINNQDYYDRYDRSKPKVYLGEYASHLPGRPMNIETALSEALYLNAVERNADVVLMTSFAPLLAKEHHTQWNPDLIYFNNTEVKPTVDYYIQKLYGQNSGNEYIPSLIKLSDNREDVSKRISVSVVKDHQSNDVIIKLVNMLPVEVNSKIDLSDYISERVKGELHVLAGDPASKDAKPEVSEINLMSDAKYKMPAYSFSLIRIKGQIK